MVEPDDVDGFDGRVGVGVGSHQHAPGVGVELDRLLEEFDARHTRHAVIGQEQGDVLAFEAKLTQDGECGRAGLGAHDAELLGVLTTKIAGERLGDGGIVVHGQG